MRLFKRKAAMDTGATYRPAPERRRPIMVFGQGFDEDLYDDHGSDDPCGKRLPFGVSCTRRRGHTGSCQCRGAFGDRPGAA